MLDLTRDLEQLRVHNSELKKVKAFERRSFYESLDKADSELEAQHNAALDKVAARHEKVLEEAEETLRAHHRAVEEENRRKQEEARKEAEQKERERVEKQRKEQELARLKAEQEAAEKAKRKAAEEAEKKKRIEQEEKERKERERVEQETKKRQEEAQKAEQEATRLKEEEAAQKQQAARQKQLGAGRLTDEEIKVHQRYVDLHQHLKKFRQYLRNEGKTNPIIKQNMGDMRRSIKKCVGQLREGKGANKNQVGFEKVSIDPKLAGANHVHYFQTQEIRTTLEKATSIAEPSVDVRQFIAFPPENIANSDDNKVPGLLIYALNILAKSLISSLITEASINQGHAEPIGIVAAQIFSLDSFIYKGYHMVDILWAKYRVVCPALWGFHGSEKTESGRRALGWWREGPDGPFVSEQAHADRMTALGAGFAALTLRNFGKTQRKNPFPNTLFWTSMHKILNIPANEIQDTHVTLLSAMLRSSAERIVGFFGHIGLAVMRKAIVELPPNLPRQSMAVNQLKLLKDLYKREKHIII